ncbi:MAG: hypothetical protein GY851_33465 [bacterium]|nr:hypothetical protein [bacterium]
MKLRDWILSRPLGWRVLIFPASAMLLWGYSFVGKDWFVIMWAMILTGWYVRSTDAVTDAQASALRILPCTAKRLGTYLWVESVVLFPLWLLFLLTGLGLLFRATGAPSHMLSWPVVLLAPAFSLAVSALFILPSVWRRTTAPKRDGRKRPQTVAALVILTVLALCLGPIFISEEFLLKFTSTLSNEADRLVYWALVPGLALVPYTWARRESLVFGSGALSRNLSDQELTGPFVFGPAGKSRLWLDCVRGSALATLSAAGVSAILLALARQMDRVEPTDVLMFLWLGSAMYVFISFAARTQTIRVMRLLPLTTRRMTTRLVAPLLCEAAALAIASECAFVLWTGRMSWTLLAIVAASTGVSLVLVVSVRIAWEPEWLFVRLGLVLAPFLILMTGLGPGLPDYNGPLSFPFLLHLALALVAHPIGVISLHRILDRNYNAYRGPGPVREPEPMPLTELPWQGLRPPEKEE